MSKVHHEKKHCPLYKKEIYWGVCYEVQDIRSDDMDMELSIETFDLDEANKLCEKCRWFHVTE